MYKHLTRWRMPKDFYCSIESERRRLASYPVVAKHRDSSLIEQVSYEVVWDTLKQKEAELPGIAEELVFSREIATGLMAGSRRRSMSRSKRRRSCFSKPIIC